MAVARAVSQAKPACRASLPADAASMKQSFAPIVRRSAPAVVNGHVIVGHGNELFALAP